MIFEQEDRDFISTTFQEIDGWCIDDSAYLTLWLMNTQVEAGQDEGVLEIGVFKGKYLSVLFQGSRRTAQPVLGIDTFQWSSREDVRSSFAKSFGSAERLSLVAADSCRLDAPRVVDMLGGRRASMISVDGDHSAAAVRSDLILSMGVLSEGGIVVVDDLMNPKAIGVSEGFYRFFLEGGEQPLRPFAYCSNKLFLTDPQHREFYTEAVWAFVREMADLPMVKEFNRQLAVGRNYIEQELLGSKILIF